MRISAVIITRNEAHNIRACLESVKWCDEAIIVDCMSEDATREIAREMGARVVETADWPGFGPQKNRAVDAASGDWILSLDADERIGEALRDEILQSIARADADGYEMPRLSEFCGRFIRHGGWYPDYVTRVFRNGKGRFTDALVHERLIVEGRVGRLTQALIHHSYRDYSDVLRKVESYSSAGALQALRSGKRSSPAGALGHGLWAFLRTWLIRGSILDGTEGFGVALMNGQASYYKYLKLWHLQRQPEQSPR
ncbi:glycosyltransferase family 2 protein [Cupriavidus sp. IK-TO18]|uniref:glycosyltransferase family 2 protein n=1 Tax=Cupriavidus sp. IK-TO18 TaxID=2782182 RepID=UPI0018978610|nr:glycosyltransferase family 2 protein [Cupriavidus sp. IK-TO18]MBF6988821.1 glycosyltransferase family 2 protein [Cupriavidus sp. IK-TO18]